MSIKLRDIPTWYVGLNHQRIAVEDLGRELIQRGFRGMTTPASWLNFTPDHLDRVQEVAGEASIERFARLWRNKQVIDWNDMSCKISTYFTVGENLRYDVRRIPTSQAIRNNIIEMCNELDKVRVAYGSAIIITSGYRDPATNSRVGGVSNSMHLTGLAVDIKPAQGNIYTFQKWIDERWYGRLGYGAKRGFVHLDMKNNKGYMSGGSKGTRWNY